MRQQRLISKILLLFIVIAAIAYGFWPEPVIVDSAIVQKAPLTVTVEEEGKTRVIDRFVISAPMTAYARRIDYSVGDSVVRKDSLVELEPLRSSILDARSRGEAQARVDASRSALRAAEQSAQATKADLDYAQQELKRMEILKQQKTISQEKFDLAKTALRRLEANYRSAVFAVEVAKFKLAEAQKTLDYSSERSEEGELEKHFVNSPVNGKILKIHRKSEGVVKLGEPLLEIGDPKALEVAVDVLSVDAVKIHQGTHVIFTRWGGEGDLEGIVETVEPTGFTKVSALGVEEQRVNVIANIVSPYNKWEKLGDGYRVDAQFVIWHNDNILQVPSSSIFRNNEEWAVYKIENNKAKLTSINIAHSNGLQTEVTAGLKAGELVISYPDNTIVDGIRIRQR